MGSGTSSVSSVPGADDRVGPERLAGRGQTTVGDELLDVAARHPGRIGDVAVDPTGRPVGDAQDADAGRVGRVNHPPRRSPRSARAGKSAAPTSITIAVLIAASATLKV